MRADVLGQAMRMFDHACDFSESADVLFEKHNVNKSCAFDYTTPAVVYYAFSCEIYLKTLYLCHDITYRKDHGLKGLYEKLPNMIKERIENTIYNYCDGLGKLIFDMKTLEEISNAFKKWRYLYERKDHSIIFSNTAFFIAFRDALREECCQTIFRQTWSAYKEINYDKIR